MMLYKKEKYFWDAIKIQQKNYKIILKKNLVHLHGLQASYHKRKAPTQRTFDKKNGECYKCGKKGHFKH